MKSNTFITLSIIIYLLINTTHTAHTFSSTDHQYRKKFSGVLINRVHKEHWVIAYRYGTDCQAEDRKNGKKLEEMITNSIRAWLRPLRELRTDRPIVDTFRFELHTDAQPDVGAEDGGDLVALTLVDLRVNFYCDKAISYAAIADRGLTCPDIYMHRGTNIDSHLGDTFTHEFGHAIGLGDTYAGRQAGGGVNHSTGGLLETAGRQPPSVMSAHLFPGDPLHISKDDVNGILWLYKFTYQDLSEEDCFFPEYVFESMPDGCVPRYPLIFEAMHGHHQYLRRIIAEDPSIDINQRDDSGSTALHYAVLSGSVQVVNPLLMHPDIWIRPRNNAGKSPLILARELGHREIATRLSTHKNALLDVMAKQKLTTKWASLKLQ